MNINLKIVMFKFTKDIFLKLYEFSFHSILAFLTHSRFFHSLHLNHISMYIIRGKKKYMHQLFILICCNIFFRLYFAFMKHDPIRLTTGVLIIILYFLSLYCEKKILLYQQTYLINIFIICL